jgi:hypothetical protein
MENLDFASKLTIDEGVELAASPTSYRIEIKRVDLYERDQEMFKKRQGVT